MAAKRKSDAIVMEEQAAKLARGNWYSVGASPYSQVGILSSVFNTNLPVRMSAQQVGDILFSYGRELLFSLCTSMGLAYPLMSAPQLRDYTHCFLRTQWQQGKFPLMENNAPSSVSSVGFAPQTCSMIQKLPEIYRAAGQCAAQTQPQKPTTVCSQPVPEQPVSTSTTNSQPVQVQPETTKPTAVPYQSETAAMTEMPTVQLPVTQKKLRKDKGTCMFYMRKNATTNTRRPNVKTKETSPLVSYVHAETMTQGMSKEDKATSVTSEIDVTPVMKTVGTVTIPLKEEKGTSTETPPGNPSNIMVDHAMMTTTKGEKAVNTAPILFEDAEMLTATSDKSDVGTLTVPTTTTEAESSTEGQKSDSPRNSFLVGAPNSGGRGSVNDSGFMHEERAQQIVQILPEGSLTNSNKKVVKITINVKLGKRPQGSHINLDESLTSKDDNRLTD